MLKVGIGNPLNSPGVAGTSDGGAGWTEIELIAADRVRSISVTVVLTHVALSQEDGANILLARGIGSDGKCYGINVSDQGYEDGYAIAGVASAPAATLGDDAGPCVARTREFLAEGGFRFSSPL